MRICFLCYRANPYSGGQGVYLKEITEELARRGHEVHAVVGPPLPEELEDVTLHVVENRQYYGKKGREALPDPDPFRILEPLDFYEYLSTRQGSFTEISTFALRSFLLVRRLHRERPFDVIIDNQSLGYGLLLYKALGIPLVAVIHHPLTIDLASVMARTPLFSKKVKTAMFYPLVMQGFVARRMDRIITVSRASRKAIIRDFHVRPERIDVVYNGINTGHYAPDHSDRNRGEVLFVGNIEDGNKGFVHLMRAMRLVRKGTRLVVVDGGSVHRKITDRFIRLYGLDDRITFVGRTNRDELVNYYRGAELLVSPSRFEGFGFPAGEAMACGTPVIVSDGGALPEVAGDAGIVVPYGDEIALARAIDRVMGDPALRRRMGRAGRERVLENFSWSGAAVRIENIITGTGSSR
jgi:glycosyltransferase involved in cell wall biosynthesis